MASIFNHSVFDGASSQESEDFEFVALAEAKNYRVAIAKLFFPYLQGDILEIGAGVGQMLADVTRICQPSSVTAVEPDANFVAQLKSNLPEAQVIHGTVDDLPPGVTFGGVLSVNVLEHIAHDTDHLCTWRNRLKPEAGHLCVLVPARPELYSPIDKDFGHFRRYTKNDLQQKMLSAGYRDIRVSYYNFIGYFAWLLNFKLMAKRGFDPVSVRIFDRWIFPPFNNLERAIGRIPLGQSLVAIARA
jgi:SAM-dependent methyltransferase